MNRGAEGVKASKTKTLAVQFRYLFLTTTIFGAGFLILTTNENSYIIFLSPKPTRTLQYKAVNSEQNHTLKTEGCRIPAMKPFTAEIENFVEYPYKLKPCISSSQALLDSDNSKIWIIQNNYTTKRDRNVLCCYQAFYRPTSIEDIRSDGVDNRVKYDLCRYFYDSIDVRDEFVRVTCTVMPVVVYKQYFAFAPKKQFETHDSRSEISNKTSAYNVLLLGIDSVSRLNFHRTMPKTINLLKIKGAIEMMGYNKVGDNTFPNLIPMLLGIKESELKKVCLPHYKASFDNCPFIWEWFKQAGYYTAFAEDTSGIGTFNYAKKGFIKTPTDYYLHTFIHEVETNVASNKDFNSFLCMQDKPLYKVLLNYIDDMTLSLKNSKLFGFFWETSMTHDYLNYPMVMDDDYVRFLNTLEARNYLKDTILIVVSDHGIRWGGIRSTKQGRLEERLPFLFILTPPSFQEKYAQAYKNLEVNSNRLSTPFDLHETLSDLIDLKVINDASIKSRSRTSYSHERGISLFLPIPSNRTCKAAAIDDHWCTCHNAIHLSKTSPEALEAALQLVMIINKLTEEYPLCARLVLSEVVNIMIMEVAGESQLNEVGWKEYLVVVKTLPGGGLFEATLRKEDSTWAPVGTVSRLNLYGQQSQCIHQYHLKLYCYCQ